MKLDWLKHAFAVEKSEDFAPTPEQVAIAEKICRWIAKRGMTTPAVMALHASQGLNYISAQTMHFFRPAVAALLDTREYAAFAEMLEHRGSIEYLCALIERFESENRSTETENETADERK